MVVPAALIHLAVDNIVVVDHKQVVVDPVDGPVVDPVVVVVY